MGTPSQKSFVTAPFTVLVDTAEQYPFTFRGIRTDADKGYAYWMVPSQRANLGRHPHSMGDYSIAGAVGSVAIERKGKEDAWGTILGWTTGWEADRVLAGRRERFEQELANLNEMESAIVICEATLGELTTTAPQWGVKSGELNGKIFFRSVLSYQQRFPRVQWCFADNTRMAEQAAFRWLFRYWKEHLKGKDQWVSTRKTFDNEPLDNGIES
jgi:hypothetical protein